MAIPINLQQISNYPNDYNEKVLNVIANNPNNFNASNIIVKSLNKDN